MNVNETFSTRFCSTLDDVENQHKPTATWVMSVACSSRAEVWISCVCTGWYEAESLAEEVFYTESCTLSWREERQRALPLLRKTARVQRLASEVSEVTCAPQEPNSRMHGRTMPVRMEDEAPGSCQG